MPILAKPEQYVLNRQSYAYSDQVVNFDIIQTGALPYHGNFEGIFPRLVPATYPHGINLRKFERICQSVFEDAFKADAAGALTSEHIANIKSVALAIVHWKMASQGGRAKIRVMNVNAKWNVNSHVLLLLAHQHQSLCKFKIGGVRIPTASAFLRFLYPTQFGIVDRRVVNNHTQPAGITTMNLRASDGYINDVRQNVEKYSVEYMPCLIAEAECLNTAQVTFNDIDEHGNQFASIFRPCDIEMALF